MTDGERAILDAIDGCDRVVAYCDEALDRFRGRKRMPAHAENGA